MAYLTSCLWLCSQSGLARRPAHSSPGQTSLSATAALILNNPLPGKIPSRAQWCTRKHGHSTLTLSHPSHLRDAPALGVPIQRPLGWIPEYISSAFPVLTSLLIGNLLKYVRHIKGKPASNSPFCSTSELDQGKKKGEPPQNYYL